jgi:ferredoxin-NADP reductase
MECVMPIYQLKLLDRYETNHLHILKFTKPEGFQFTPGQYGGFTLMNPAETDAGGITRRFSLLSTPADPFIAIATRRQNSAFKRVLCDMQPGDLIKFAGPTGNFTLHTDTHIPAVFIAGGIGIAPFHSMITHALAQYSTQLLYLFYGNQHPSNAAFLDELSVLAKAHPTFKFIPTFDQAEPAWEGETGYISHTMIKKYIPDIQIPIYYICGSPAMVTTLQELLVEMGIDEAHIRTEDFPGY